MHLIYHNRNKQNNVITGALYYYQESERKNKNIKFVISHIQCLNRCWQIYIPFSTAVLKEHRPVSPVAPNITTRFTSPIINANSALSRSRTRNYIYLSSLARQKMTSHFYTHLSRSDRYIRV